MQVHQIKIQDTILVVLAIFFSIISFFCGNVHLFIFNCLPYSVLWYSWVDGPSSAELWLLEGTRRTERQRKSPLSRGGQQLALFLGHLLNYWLPFHSMRWNLQWLQRNLTSKMPGKDSNIFLNGMVKTWHHPLAVKGWAFCQVWEMTGHLRKCCAALTGAAFDKVVRVLWCCICSLFLFFF